MPPAPVLDIALQYGILGLVLLGLAWMWHRGTIRGGREVKQLEDALAFERAERIRERQEHEREIQRERKETSFWQDIAWTNTRVADQVVSALPPRRKQE